MHSPPNSKPKQSAEDLMVWHQNSGRGVNIPAFLYTVTLANHFIRNPSVYIEDEGSCSHSPQLITVLNLRSWANLPNGLKYVIHDAITSRNGWIENIRSNYPDLNTVDIARHRGWHLEARDMRIQNDAGGQSFTVRVDLDRGNVRFDLCIRYEEIWKDAVYSVLRS